MKILFRMFFWEFVKFSGKFSFYLIVTSFVLLAFFSNTKITALPFALVFIFLPGLRFVVLTRPLGQNIDWVRLLPLKRTQILTYNLLHHLLGGVLIFVGGIFESIILVFISVIFKRNDMSFLDIKNAWTEFSKLNQFDFYAVESRLFHGIHTFVFEHALSVWLVCLGALTFLILCSVSFVFQNSQQEINSRMKMFFQATIKGSDAHKMKRRNAFIILGAAMAFYFGRDILPESELNAVFIGIGAFVFFTLQRASQKLCFSKSSQQKLLMTAALTPLVFAIITIQFGRTLALSDNHKQAVNALVILEGYAPSLEKSELARFVNQDLQSISGINDFEILEIYKKQHAKNGKIDLKQNKELNLSGWVEYSKNLYQLSSLIQHFDAKTFGDLEVSAFLNRLEKLDTQFKSGSAVFNPLVEADVSSEFLIQQLVSRNGMRERFALFKMRYARNSAFLPLIMNELSGFSDSTRMRALKTLTVLSGKHYTLKDLSLWLTSSGRAPAEIMPLVNCDGILPNEIQSIEELKPFQADILNVCLRDYLIAHKTYREILAFEDLDWIDTPLSRPNAKALHEILGLKSVKKVD